MPLTEKGKKIKSSMRDTYGKEKGDQVFYASQNAGSITGTHEGDRKHTGSDGSKKRRFR